MLLSNPNRKSFSLSLNIPLTRSSSGRPSKDGNSPLHKLHHKSPRSPSRDKFSAPHSPLVPSHLKLEQPILSIPLTESLDPAEKMKLLKKTRKLSRILGEVPIPVSVDDVHDLRYTGYTGLLEEPLTATSPSTSASSSPGKPPPGIEQQIPLKRSATVSHNRFAQQREIQRARSLASLRPSLSIPLSPTRSPQLSPVEGAWPHGLAPLPASPVSVSPTSPSGDSARGTIGPTRRDSLTSVTSRRTSISSLLFERTPEQVQRARAAKLARQLGENIPPEVLLRATSPPPASPSIMSFAEASMELKGPAVRRSSSTRRAEQTRPKKRRLSLDVKTFMREPNLRADVPFLSETLKHRVLKKTSKLRRPNTAGATMESPKRHPPMAQSSDVDSDLEDDPELALAVEKQRALNVRRARKMNQVSRVLSCISGHMFETVCVERRLTVCFVSAGVRK